MIQTFLWKMMLSKQKRSGVSFSSKDVFFSVALFFRSLLLALLSNMFTLLCLSISNFFLNYS